MNFVRELAPKISVGRLFQSRGAMLEKARSPKRTVFVRGIVRRGELEDRRQRFAEEDFNDKVVER